MAYRIETASSGRAVCRQTECKKADIKIEKDELRLGSWVSFQDGGSWHWRHWGCVTGKQIENLRRHLEDPADPSKFRWDFLDGYEGSEKNSLDKHPDLQEKVRRVIIQGFIDPEDFNGDPEMNKLGESGNYTPATKKKQRDDAKAREHELALLQERIKAAEAEREVLLLKGASTAKSDAEIADAKAELQSPADKKQGMKRVKSDDPEPDQKPKKKARKTKPKKEESDDDDIPALEAISAHIKQGSPRISKPSPVEPTPVFEDDPYAFGRPFLLPLRTTEELIDEQDGINDTASAVSTEPKQLAKRGRGKQAVKEEENDGAVADVTAPKRAARGKKVKNEPTEEENGVDEDVPAEPELPAKRGRGKKAVKKEEDANEEVTVPKRATRGKKVNYGPFAEENGVDDDFAVESALPVKRGRGKKAVKSEAVEEENYIDDENSTIEETSVDDTVEGAATAPKKRAARGKKAVKEEQADAKPAAAPAKRGRPKKAPKEEPVDEEHGVSDDDDVPAPPKVEVTAPKKRAAQGKKAVKEEQVDAEPAAAPAKKGRARKAVNYKPVDEPVEEASDADDEVPPEAESEAIAPKRAPRGKKSVKAAAEPAAAKKGGRRALSRGQTEF